MPNIPGISAEELEVCPHGDYPVVLEVAARLPQPNAGLGNDIGDRSLLEVQSVVGRPATMLHKIEMNLAENPVRGDCTERPQAQPRLRQDAPCAEVTRLSPSYFVLISCCIGDTLDHLAKHFESKQ